MSITTIKQFYAHIVRAEFDAAIGLIADDAEIVFYGPASIPLSGIYRGKVEIGTFFGIVGGQLVVEAFEPREFIDGGDTIAVLGRERSRVLATGKSFDVNWVQVWTVKQGRIVHLRDFFDTGSMLEAFL